MERYYFCNLLFSQNELIDTEKAIWTIQSSLSDPTNYLTYTSTSMRITKADCYLNHTQDMNITTNKFTIAFSYKINLKSSYEASELTSEICSVQWNHGSINILDFEEVPVIAISIDDNIITVPVDYEKDTGWNNIVFCCDNNLIRIFHNGKLKKEDIYTNPINYNFTYFNFGNCSSSLESMISSIDYNYFVFVNDSLYETEFDVKNMLHSLFPEVVTIPLENEIYEEFNRAPYIYSSNKSYKDIINDHEVVRPKNYKPDTSLSTFKYRFD